MLVDAWDQDDEWQDIIIEVDNNSISFENIEVTIPQYSEPGTWTLQNIDAEDAIGNDLEIYRDSDGNYRNNATDEIVHLDFKTEFDVISLNPDTTQTTFKLQII